MDTTEELLASAQQLIAAYGLNLVWALAILIVGRIAAKWSRSLIETLMIKGKADPIIVNFVGNISYVLLLVFIVIAALGQLGIQTTSLIAILGAAGLAIGLALQSSLSNFAAGFLMIIFKPFKVGDFIEGGGTMGTVLAIHIFTTTLKTGDNKLIIIPNSKLAGDNITNFSANENRRVDFTIGVSYEADLAEVRKVLQSIIAEDERILAEPKPLIAVGELADNSVNFVVRVWARTEDYWGVFFDTTEKVKLRFDEAGIGIPYPQRDVHLYEHKTA